MKANKLYCYDCEYDHILEERAEEYANKIAELEEFFNDDLRKEEKFNSTSERDEK
jgi:hypothetical protein